MDYIRYAELVGRKAKSIARMMIYLQKGADIGLVIAIEKASLQKTELQLTEFEKNPSLERALAKAEIIRDRITPSKDIITGIDFCTSCQKFVNSEIDAPLCSKTRYAERIKTPCEEHIDGKIINREEEVRLAKEDFEFYNAFLKLIDEGILENYKERLKIK